MKKAGILLVVSFVITFIGLISLVSAVETCYDGVSPTQCVCGHTPNSTQGFGQIIIGGFTPSIISCNNIADGVCPEDFSGGGIVANCSNCPDADCTVAGPSSSGSVYGYVRDINGKPIEKAIVMSHPIKWNSSASLENNLSTRSDGFYNFSGFLTGSYYFSASKETYDTQLIPVSITRGKNTIINFVLLNGTCHEDCTNSYNRCNAACDGIAFANGNTCQFYNSTVKDLCNNRLKGTEVLLAGGTGENSTFIKCCGDQPLENPYTKYYSKATTSNGNIKNLIKVEKIAKYNDVPVRVVIAYWQQQ
jgi:hypothetical protein